MMSARDDIERLQRRRHTWTGAFVLAPLLVACAVPLSIAFIVDGGNWSLVDAFGFCLYSSVPVALGSALALACGWRRGPGAALLPALGGLLGGVPLQVWAAWNAATDSKGVGLMICWGASLVFGVLGALLGWFLSLFPDVRPRLSCERALDALRCRRCGYSFAGLDSPVCPECGVTRP